VYKFDYCDFLKIMFQYSVLFDDRWMPCLAVQCINSVVLEEMRNVDCNGSSQKQKYYLLSKKNRNRNFFGGENSPLISEK